MSEPVAGLGKLAGLVEETVGAMLPDEPPPERKDRRVHDSVWGTIALRGHEIAVIDTPLVQRLRRIKQLGSTHLVFPGAVHTRFEHTLGVVHQTQRMCEALRASNEGSVSDDDLANIRMAALCHDLGHGPFSHYSEEFFGRMAPLRGMLCDAGDKGAAELMSAAIVTCGPMRAYLGKVSERSGTKLDPDLIASAIVGAMPDGKAYLGEVVHGPFDADKLDYLSRDGLYCGMPVKIDTDRIYSSMAITDSGDGKRRLAGHRRAAAALMQVVHHKQHMHASVYHHDVSRSFRTMYSNALTCAEKDRTPIGGKPLESPADFLALDDETLLAPATVDPASRAASLLARLRERRLFKVAYEARVGVLDESTIQSARADPQATADEIADQAGVPREEVGIDLARRMSNRESQEMLIQDDGRAVPLGELLPLDESGNSLHNFLERHLMLCAPEHMEAVRKAAPKILEGLL